MPQIEMCVNTLRIVREIGVYVCTEGLEGGKVGLGGRKWGCKMYA